MSNLYYLVHLTYIIYQCKLNVNICVFAYTHSGNVSYFTISAPNNDAVYVETHLPRQNLFTYLQLATWKHLDCTYRGTPTQAFHSLAVRTMKTIRVFRWICGKSTMKRYVAFRYSWPPIVILAGDRAAYNLDWHKLLFWKVCVNPLNQFSPEKWMFLYLTVGQQTKPQGATRLWLCYHLLLPTFASLPNCRTVVWK